AGPPDGGADRSPPRVRRNARPQGSVEALLRPRRSGLERDLPIATASGCRRQLPKRDVSVRLPGRTGGRNLVLAADEELTEVDRIEHQRREAALARDVRHQPAQERED